MLLHYLGKLKNQKFAILMHVEHISNGTFYHLSHRQKKWQMSLNKFKDQQHAKYQHFTFCSFTVLSKLKDLQLSTVGLSTIKHQHSKTLTRWIEAT